MSWTHQYRVSWDMWLPEDPSPTHRSYVKPEDEARDQYEGLLTMMAPHGLRPCGEHIWNPKLERRLIQESQWEELEERAKAHGAQGEDG